MTNHIRTHLVRIRPRNDALYVSQGRTVLATDRDGFVAGGPEHGLFVHQTRLLSKYRYLIDGESMLPVVLSNYEQHNWLGYYITLPPGIQTPEPDQGSGQMQELSQQTLEMRLSRYVGEGIHEDVDLTNFTQQATSFRLELEVDADFADVVETKGARRQFGALTRDWREVERSWELVFDYKAEHDYDVQGNKGTARIHRGLTLRIESAGSAPAYEDGRITFQIELGPIETWHACLNLIPFIDGKMMPPLYGCRSFTATGTEYDHRRELYLNEATRVATPETSTLAPVVVGALDQARRDLAALRMYDLDRDEHAWVMAAGLPIYVAVYGRDILTAAWQASLVSTDMMRGALAELADWQGRETNDWRDEQPGRMLHEAHTGPLEMLNFNPRQRYYGSVTTSGFYPVAVSELWHWTGDKELIRPFIEPSLRALAWLDECADLDGDGLYEYKTRSTQGVTNQGWKDSGDAIVYEDGSEVKAPIATCEEQGFAYLAKLHMSEVLWWLDEKDHAKRLYTEAAELKKRFNEAFWMEDEGFFAMGLDGDKRQIKSIGSNAGHCLATAIVEQEHVLKTVGRLIADDMFTGWGIRTLSSAHPSFNPYSYHRGTVWPVEHGTFALAFLRYGLFNHMEMICRAQFEAAALFDFYRLPELFSGHQRDADHPFPAIYPFANSPQAWSASAVFCFVQAMLGLYPYAPLNMLLVDPHLPDWLPEITLAGLKVGDARVTIRFYRTPDGASAYEVLDKRGRLHVIRQPSPWSLTASFAERLKDALTSFMPGR
ncbi:MAG TPA: glycogen debranching N-terminal domain-containing protein [Blastocatellia bacterium]|nr:glycogen debranching N-terminal domain-containing protein [Blastocatellia bacterium]